MESENSVFVLQRPNGNGDVNFVWQKGTGSLLATYGSSSDVLVFNRRGAVVEKLRVTGACFDVSWDEDGDLLGVLMAGSSTLLLWDSNTQKRTNVDLGLRDNLSCLIWSKKPAILAAGTTRGNMAVFNNNTGKRIPVLGKHNKKITCGAWSRDNILALGSEDKNVSISNSDGDTLRIINLRAEPSQIAFSDMKMDNRINRDNTVSILVGKRTLFLYNLDDPENPVELAFQQKYGNVVKYSWFGDGYVLLGFSEGYFIAISTHLKEVGQELFQVINHRDGLKDIALSPSLRMVASCGDNVVKMHDMNNLQETASVITLHQATGIDRIGWSKDGQLLAMATTDGSIHVHLTLLPSVAAVCGASAAILSSINVVTVHTFAQDGTSRSVEIESPVEPEVISLSSSHFVVALHNRAWFYDMTPVEPLLIREREYLTNIKSLNLSGQYASVLYTSGTLQLHHFEPESKASDERANKIFSGGKAGVDEAKITDHFLNGDLLVMSTDMGHVQYFSLSDWKIATEYRHDCGIKAIYCDSSATRLIFTDLKSQIYLYNPVLDSCLYVVDFPGPLKGVVWDLTDRNCFVMYDSTNAYTHIYNKDSIHGPNIVKVSASKFPPKQVPLLLINGLMQLETATGKIAELTLSSHQIPAMTAGTKELVRCLKKQLVLQRYSDSWRLCQALNEPEYWKMLAESAVSHLELDWAIRGYAALKDAGTVWTLTELVEVEDRNLLSGHVAMLLSLFDMAEEFYLRSSDPSEALLMRRNLMQWDRALVLAQKLAPNELPAVSCDYGMQLELTGKYTEALAQFESGLESARDELTEKCMAGIARNAIRIGDVTRGLKIAFESKNNLQLIRDCGEILEERKFFAEAATLYEKSQQWDKAAAMCIKTKNWTKVSELFPHVTSRRIYLQFAKAKEADGRWEEAAKAYRKAGDTENLVRIYLEKQENSQAAVALVQETGSMEGARMVAAHFQRVSDFASAIKFLVMSECFEEAFQLARRTSLLELYGSLLQGTKRTDDFRSLAVHFEGERNSFLAGKYYYLAGEFSRALRHLMRVAKNNAAGKEAIPLAIELVGEANDDNLTKQLVSYLNGETDGVQKDPRYLLQLYVARGMYREAGRTAVVVAAEEQMNGGYRAAHDLLVSTCLQLRRHGVRVPQDVMSALALLHSYILVRVHARVGEHSTAARLLTRVAASISHFPAHIVPILTSAVIECSRAGMRNTAFQHAAILMQPEYRNLIDPKYRKKIESVVRKPAKLDSEDAAPTSLCPVCDSNLLDYDLYCSRCKTSLPFCIASGRHITREDLTACPRCNFPAIHTEFTQLLKHESACPMCSETVQLEMLQKINNPDKFIERDH